MLFDIKLSAAAAFALIQTARAGAGSVVNGCIYLDTAPEAPIIFDLIAGGPQDHCMYDIGTSASLNVTDAGVHCVSLGYVEAKASDTDWDTCATDRSIWSVAYNAPGGLSQSVRTEWTSGNECRISSNDPRANVCDQPALCTETDVSWPSGTTGPIFVIFSPGKTKKIISEDTWYPGYHHGTVEIPEGNN